MPLANIAVAPATDAAKRVYDFSHHQDHVQIVQAINSQQGTTLPIRAIFPVGAAVDSWKRLHQVMHNEMNEALALNGQDLIGPIDDGWHAQNYREHQAARAALGI